MVTEAILRRFIVFHGLLVRFGEPVIGFPFQKKAIWEAHHASPVPLYFQLSKKRQRADYPAADS